MTQTLLPLITHAVTQFTAGTVTSCLERILGAPDGDKFRAAVLTHVLTICDDMIASHRRHEKCVCLKQHDSLQWQHNLH